MKDYLKYVTVGFEILVTMGVCVGLGYFLDSYFQPTKPWFLLGFSLLGCIAVVYRLIKLISSK